MRGREEERHETTKGRRPSLLTPDVRRRVCYRQNATRGRGRIFPAFELFLPSSFSAPSAFSPLSPPPLSILAFVRFAISITEARRKRRRRKRRKRKKREKEEGGRKGWWSRKGKKKLFQRPLASPFSPLRAQNGVGRDGGARKGKGKGTLSSFSDILSEQTSEGKLRNDDGENRIKNYGKNGKKQKDRHPLFLSQRN